MFQMAIIENMPAVGLGKMLSPTVVGKQCCWVEVAILVPISHEPDPLHGFMWLHTLKTPMVSISIKHSPDETWVTT